VAVRISVALVLPVLCALAACGGDAPRAQVGRTSAAPAVLAGESRAPASATAADRTAVAMEGTRMEARTMEGESGREMTAEPARQLDDAGAAAREQAIYEIAPQGAGLQQLAALAAGDPDAGVRRAAVMQLGAGEGSVVAPALTEALRDSDAGVVEEALVALAAVGDARAAAHVRPLLAHPDPEIQSLAEEAIETLEGRR
jgi:HEAT repeat protein